MKIDCPECMGKPPDLMHYFPVHARRTFELASDHVQQGHSERNLIAFHIGGGTPAVDLTELMGALIFTRSPVGATHSTSE
jgi:hypothetical protein